MAAAAPVKSGTYTNVKDALTNYPVFIDATEHHYDKAGNRALFPDIAFESGIRIQHKTPKGFDLGRYSDFKETSLYISPYGYSFKRFPGCCKWIVIENVQTNAPEQLVDFLKEYDKLLRKLVFSYSKDYAYVHALGGGIGGTFKYLLSTTQFKHMNYLKENTKKFRLLDDTENPNTTTIIYLCEFEV